MAFNSCFNPALFATGARLRLRYSLVGPATGTLDGDSTLVGDSVFNGSVALQRDTIAAYALSIATYTDSTSEYIGPPTPAGVTQFGYTARSTQNPAAGLTTVTYSPPWQDKTSVLTTGASDTVTYDMRVASSSPSVTATVTQTTRFVGVETVTVPAGTFVNACRFEYTTAVNGGAPTVTTTWLSAGSGVMIKGFGPGTNQQLVSGALNGVDVR